MSFQAEKQVVRGLQAALAKANAQNVAEVMAGHYAPGVPWRGMHPFNEQTGVDAIASTFWAPLLSAFPNFQLREDIFFAGLNEIDGFASRWVVSMGHLMGNFDAPWLGIVPTYRMAFLRYVAFYRVEGGKIAEEALFCDIPHLMIQAGQNPFPPQTAAQLVHPGPLGHGGLLEGPQPPQEGEKTLAAINAMITDLGTWSLGLPLEEELARTWNPDMIWWGPAGIGSAFTIERYARQHSGPFRASFAKRSRTGHLARLAEGHFGGFFGWPNFTARLTGGFMGMPASEKLGEFRVVDIYRRGGDKLAENWVFIDLLHFFSTLGLDVLARQDSIARGGTRDVP